MTKERFVALMNEQSALAQTALDRAVKAHGCGNGQECYRFLYEFVLRKLLLYNDGITEENLIKLSDLSTRRILQLTGGDFTLSDVSVNCTGIISAVTKKILLMHAIQKAFNVVIQPEKTADIETVEMLADEICALR